MNMRALKERLISMLKILIQTKNSKIFKPNENYIEIPAGCESTVFAEIIDNGLTDAKDSERTVITDETKEMFESLKDKSEFEKNKYYRNMVKEFDLEYFVFYKTWIHYKMVSV